MRRTEPLTSLDNRLCFSYVDQYGQRLEIGMARMKARPTPSSTDLLELDIDARLGEIWLEAWKGADVDGIGSLLRFAYGRGYCDALIEPERGRLCRDHGLLIPASRGAE